MEKSVLVSATEGGYSVVLAGFLQESIGHIIQWIIVTFCVILCNLVVGIRKSLMMSSEVWVILLSLDLNYDGLSDRGGYPWVGIHHHLLGGCCNGGGGDCEVLKKNDPPIYRRRESPNENFKFFLGCAKEGRISEISKGCVVEHI